VIYVIRCSRCCRKAVALKPASQHVRLSDVLPPVLACASSLPEWLTNSTGIPTPELTQCATKLTVGNQITLVAIEQHDGLGQLRSILPYFPQVGDGISE